MKQGSEFIYSVPVGQSKPGETCAYRHPKYKDALNNTLYPNAKVCRDLFYNAVNKHPDRPFLGSRQQPENKYVFKTYQEVDKLSRQLGSGILKMKLAEERNEYHNIKINVIGIISENREEYALVELACHSYNFCLATLFEGLMFMEQAFDMIGLSTCICSSGGVRRLLTNEKKIVQLKNIVCLDPIELQDIELAKNANVNLINFKEVLDIGQHNLVDPMGIDISPSQICTFVFTSGTEGAPKAVMINEENFIACIASTLSIENHDFQDFDTGVSLAPFSHIAERMVFFIHISHYSKYCLVSKDPTKVMQDIKDAQPTLIVAAARFLNKIYQGLNDKIQQQSKLKQFIIRLGVKSKIDNLYKFNQYSNQFWDRLVFQKFRDALGGKVRALVNFGAPLSPEIKNFLMVAFQSTLTNYYGSTETIGNLTVTSVLDIDGASQHCGGPSSTCEFKLIDEPDMNYLTDRKDPNLNPQGEICIRGKAWFSGYYKNEALTKQYLSEDGWYRMGDIGEILPNGALKIIDRKRALVKLITGGLFISPERVEQCYLELPIAQDVFIHGDGTRYYMIGIIFPSQTLLDKLAKEKGIQGTFEELCKRQDLTEAVLEQLKKHGQSRGLFEHEQPKKICFATQNFKTLGITNQLQKTMRHKARKVFEKEIEILYQD